MVRFTFFIVFAICALTALHDTHALQVASHFEQPEDTDIEMLVQELDRVMARNAILRGNLFRLGEYHTSWDSNIYRKK